MHVPHSDIAVGRGGHRQIERSKSMRSITSIDVANRIPVEQLMERIIQLEAREKDLVNTIEYERAQAIMFALLCLNKKDFEMLAVWHTEQALSTVELPGTVKRNIILHYYV